MRRATFGSRSCLLPVATNRKIENCNQSPKTGFSQSLGGARACSVIICLSGRHAQLLRPRLANAGSDSYQASCSQHFRSPLCALLPTAAAAAAAAVSVINHRQARLPQHCFKDPPPRVHYDDLSSSRRLDHKDGCAQYCGYTRVQAWCSWGWAVRDANLPYACVLMDQPHNKQQRREVKYSVTYHHAIVEMVRGQSLLAQCQSRRRKERRVGEQAHTEERHYNGHWWVPTAAAAAAADRMIYPVMKKNAHRNDCRTTACLKVHVSACERRRGSAGCLPSSSQRHRLRVRASLKRARPPTQPTIESTYYS